jgi:hypothetical protein
MTLITQNSRHLLKRSQISGNTPTVKTGSTSHTDGTWIDTEIYPGELYLNMGDKKLYFGWEDISGNTGIVLVNPFLNGTGSCITDFYVSNIYGCSPITIHDSTQSQSSTASGLLSFAFGNQVVASGDFSTASGYITQANGEGSFAIGQASQANGIYSTASGNYTQANGSHSHAEGSDTVANGNYSHTEGNSTSATTQATWGHAEGRLTLVNGEGSHAEGFGTIVNGDYSHAEGNETIAEGDYQLVVGRFNLTASTDGAFIIGNGTAGNRSNLLEAANSGVTINGSLTATTYYGDGSNLTGIGSAAVYQESVWTSFNTSTRTVSSNNYGSGVGIAVPIYVNKEVTILNSRLECSAIAVNPTNCEFAIYEVTTGTVTNRLFHQTFQASGTGLYTFTTNLTLQPGVYAYAVSQDIIIGWRSFEVSNNGFGVDSNMGASTFITGKSKSSNNTPNPYGTQSNYNGVMPLAIFEIQV